MSKDLKIQVLLSAMDKLSAPFKNAQKTTQQLSSVLNENKTKLRTLSREYNKNESQIKKYRDTLNPLKSKLTENTQALSKSYAEVRRMKSALKNMSSPTAGFTKKLDDAKKNLEKLKKEQTENIAKLKEARNQFQRNGVSASLLGQRQRELQAKMKGANKEIDQQRAKLDKLNEKARRQNIYRQRVDSLRTKAEQYANIGGRAIATHTMMKDKIAQPVSAFAQAEVAATNLKVAMMDKDGKVPETFEKVNKLAMQLGDKLPGTTADFQDLMTMLVRQGMSVETILGGTGEAAAYLSVQLEMPPRQAAEFAAKMQDATRTTEKDMMDLMDVIQKGFYAGVDPTNMLGTFKNLGSAMDLINKKWSGGYAGNGGKYEPKGIFHGGEYVMTKEATSRLGIHTLNALNYGKQALIAGGLGISVATAAPVQVDHRPPISARPVATQVTQPMNVQITINAAQGMDERMIAQQVAKELQRIQNQQQARSRNSLRDRV
ncbi:phage tail tape measure protein [Rodentibacter ratti]|uniref:Phage tail tape measure protein n=1 Tax=Rodentibacter ratti TaxID=1906745 RepID=A0A1V3LEL8_9PAST|nr:phage tail tape measure protein [Rodentibacter ratti]OOF87913.1 phage tail tape measure protein [Rodentibacter ratti]